MFWSKPEEPPEEKQTSFLTIIFYMYLFFVFKGMYKQYKEKSNFNKFDFIHRKKGKKDKKDKNKTKSETKSVENSLKKIIGLETVKEEIKYYMELINDKSKYEEWNVALPKGILLAGPPGTGKTLLVKTMAEYLDIPVLSVSGSSFVEMYVGVGAARVRKLFSKARELEKCIIFIQTLILRLTINPLQSLKHRN